MTYITQDNNHLVRLAKMGDKQASDILVENNTGLIWNIVKKFSNRGYDLDDLFQIGAIGLIKAIKKFNFDFNVKFSTYAVPMIIGEIKRFLRDDGMIKVSRSIKQNSNKARITKDLLSKELGREPTIGEIADRLNITPQELAVAIDAGAGPEFLFSAIYDKDTSNMKLIDTVSNNDKTEIEVIDRILLNEALGALEKRDKKIILLRYFKGMTQAEVSKILGISQVQISRLEKKIIKEIKLKMNVT